MTAPSLTSPWLSRNVSIALAVVLLHVALIWTLQNGLLMKAAEVLIPAEVLSQIVSPPAPPAAPKVQPAPTPVPPRPRPTPVTPAAPLAVATPQPAPSAAAPVAPQPAPVETTAASAAPAVPQAATAPAAPTVAAAVQPPSSNADYLQNPKPPYPPLSARLGETGKTVYKVWIGVDGKAQRAELVTSSGFPRLDKAAYETVMGWRYVPGKRGGVAEVMAFNVPIHWELRN